MVVIYTCCDGNPEWFGEIYSLNGLPVVVEIVRTSSSASFGEYWIKLLLSRICLEESWFSVLFSRLRFMDILEGEDTESKDYQFSSKLRFMYCYQFLLKIILEILKGWIGGVTVSKDVALFVYGIFNKSIGVLEHAVRGKSGLPGESAAMQWMFLATRLLYWRTYVLMIVWDERQHRGCKQCCKCVIVTWPHWAAFVSACAPWTTDNNQEKNQTIG